MPHPTRVHLFSQTSKRTTNPHTCTCAPNLAHKQTRYVPHVCIFSHKQANAPPTHTRAHVHLTSNTSKIATSHTSAPFLTNKQTHHQPTHVHMCTYPRNTQANMRRPTRVHLFSQTSKRTTNPHTCTCAPNLAHKQTRHIPHVRTFPHVPGERKPWSIPLF